MSLLTMTMISLSMYRTLAGDRLATISQNTHAEGVVNAFYSWRLDAAA